jgi:hypothetical protein
VPYRKEETGMRTLAISCLVAGLVLEALVLTAIVQTRSAVSKGGDVITLAGDGMPINVGGETKTFAKGTYVMTREGLLRLRWHWVMKNAYATVPAPLALVAVGLYVYRRRA